jgi:hypothetical protein
VFLALDREWGRLAGSPLMRASEKAWWAAEPSLAGLHASEIVKRVTWCGYWPSAEGTGVLSALLRLAACPNAARSLLQALLPRIRAENVYTRSFGHGVGDPWRRQADTAADFVAECFAAVRRHAGEDREDISRLVVQEAARRLRTAREAERRHQRRTLALSSGGAALVPAGLYSGRSSAEWLASAVLDAWRDGVISQHQAALVYATRVKGVPASEVGRQQGLPPRAVYYALTVAERALLSVRAGLPVKGGSSEGRRELGGMASGYLPRRAA